MSDCDACGGSGRKTCDECDGTGTGVGQRYEHGNTTDVVVRCGVCHGHRTVPCDECPAGEDEDYGSDDDDIMYDDDE